MTSSTGSALTPARAGAYVLVLALAAYANATGNGFALDDGPVLVTNPVVTEGLWGEALLGPYWHGFREGTGLYRPLTVTGFAVEWILWRGSPLGFHLVSVLAHGLASLLLFRLILHFAPVGAALAGAAFFALHPVHVEAVANVVGRSELYVALATFSAGLVYLNPGLRADGRRGVRLVVLALLYLVGLGSKEGAVMLPAALLLLEALRPGPGPLRARLVREVPTLVGLAAVLGGYLMVRMAVLGTVAGGAAAPELMGLTSGGRVLAALSVWPEYLRLLLFPLSLSSDYSPAVLLVPAGLDASVLAGGAILAGLAVLAVALRRRAPLVAAGIGWFALTVLPVSNLLFPAGILLAERTLYLPSAGGALVVAGAGIAVAGVPAGARRALAGLAVAAGVAFLVRTVDRNPTWFSTFTVMSTLAEEHPESAVAMRARANGLERVGDRRAAADLWRTVLALQPRHYGFLVDASRFFAAAGERRTAESLAVRAVGLRPHDPAAYRALAEQYLLDGRGREAHRVALDGLARSGGDPALWALVSESYIAKGDLEASLRARRAALGEDPTSARDWVRLADVLDALGRAEEAAVARRRAASLGDGGDETSGGAA